VRESKVEKVFPRFHSDHHHSKDQTQEDIFEEPL
jgi:hypothetical protein